MTPDLTKDERAYLFELWLEHDRGKRQVEHAAWRARLPELREERRSLFVQRDFTAPESEPPA